MVCRSFLGQGLQAVDLPHGQWQTTAGREVDNALGHVGRQRLAALIVEDVSLRAADATTQGLLRQAQRQADFFDMVHGRNISGTCISGQQRRLLPFKQRR